MTDSTANIALMREAFTLFNAGDFEQCKTLMAPGFIINLAGVPEQRRGFEAWQLGIDIIRQGFPDLQARIDDILADGDRVAIRLTFSGTHTGEFQGIPATGREVAYMSNEFYRIENGVIAEEWICSDVITLMSQISDGAPHS